MPLPQAVETLVVGALLWLVNRYRSESTNLKLPNEELVRAAIDLAQLDLVKRIGRLELLPIDGAMVDDVTCSRSFGPPSRRSNPA
jgi:hypothetical protein